MKKKKKKKKKQKEELVPGCWVDHEYYGKAVLIRQEDGESFIVRYKAVRWADKQTIWVLLTCYESELTYVDSPDAVSRKVLTLTGPYGAGVKT